MAKEEFDKLGFATEEEYQRIRSQATVQEGRKEGKACVPVPAVGCVSSIDPAT